MNERMKKLRKALGLTQQEFADKIGIVRGNIATYETGKSKPGDAVVSLICREFNVNDEWLRTGNGEMFKAAPSGALDALADTYRLTHGEYILIEKFVNMKPESRQIIMDYIVEVAAAFGNQDAPVEPHAPAFPGSIDIDAEVASYRAQLEEQKKVEGGLSVSGGRNSTSGEKMA